MLIFDTNVLIDFCLLPILNLAEERANKAKLLLDPDKQKLVATTNITEFSVVLQKVIPSTHKFAGSDTKYIAQKICTDFLQKSEALFNNYFPDHSDLELAKDIYGDFFLDRYSIGFDFNDALVAAIAINKKFELITNDKILAEVYDSLIQKTNITNE